MISRKKKYETIWRRPFSDGYVDSALQKANCVQLTYLLNLSAFQELFKVGNQWDGYFKMQFEGYMNNNQFCVLSMEITGRKEKCILLQLTFKLTLCL